MKKKGWKSIYVSVGLLAAFALWTTLLYFVDVAAIGPRGSSVGFATLNGFFHECTGANMSLYVLTDWLGLVPIAVALGFAVLGLVQWIKRRSICKVDKTLFALGGFYLIVMAAYVVFEFVVVNRRPVLIDGYLEASYPSSTTMLVACVMPTACMQLHARIQNKTLRRTMNGLIFAFTVFMILGRLISGVHWLSDIIGGLLLSAGLVRAYYGATCFLE